MNGYEFNKTGYLRSTCTYIIEAEYLQDIQYMLATRPSKVRSLQHAIQEIKAISLQKLLSDDDTERRIPRGKSVTHFGSLYMQDMSSHV